MSENKVEAPKSPINSDYIDSVESLIKSKVEEIPIDVHVLECITIFLNRFYAKVAHFSSLSTQTGKIEYLLIKRFLFTAYNNLVEMDLTISQGRVKEPYKNLIEAEELYGKLTKISGKPISEIYSRVFLSQQKSYALINKDVEQKKSELSALDTLVKNLHNELQLLKSELKNLDKKDPEYEEKEADFKRKNTSYTDSIHLAANIRENLEFAHGKIIEFRSQHLAEFDRIFNDESDTLKKEILELLDSLSYLFDQILWEEARESTIVKKFFKNAKIEGSFSSKTYLQYFLKNIGNNTKNEEHKKLRDLLSYLERTASKHIFLLGKNIDELTDLRQKIESLDKDYSVIASADIDKLEVEYTRKPFNLLVLDDDVRCDDYIALIKNFWKKFRESKKNVPILIRFEDPTYDEITNAGVNGIRYFMYKRSTEEELREKIREIL